MRRSTWACVVICIVVLLGAVSCDDGDGGSTPPPPTTTSPPPPPPPPPPALPDLVITQVSRTPSGVVAPGTTCRFSVSVRNRGEAAYGGRIVVSGPGNYSGGFNGLEPGQTKVATVEYPVHSPGATYSGIVFTVDPDNVIKESDEANNSSGEHSIQTTG